jgi:hypothetical protein
MRRFEPVFISSGVFKKSGARRAGGRWTFRREKFSFCVLLSARKFL